MNNARPCEHHWSRSTFGGAVFRDEKSGFLQTWFHAKSKNLHFRLGSWFLVIGGLQSCLQKELYSALNTSRWKWFCHWFCRWCWTWTTSIQRAFAHSWRIQWHVQAYRFHCISKKCPSSWILIVDIKDTPMDSSKSSSHCCQGLLVLWFYARRWVLLLLAWCRHPETTAQQVLLRSNACKNNTVPKTYRKANKWWTVASSDQRAPIALGPLYVLMWYMKSLKETPFCRLGGSLG